MHEADRATVPAPEGRRHAGPVARALVAWTHCCLRSPWAVVGVALLTAALSAGWTVRSLGYKVNRNDLVDPGSDYNRLWIDYVAEFGEDDDAVIVVETPSRAETIRVLEEVSAEVARDGELFRSVFHAVDLSRIRAKGLHYLAPGELSALETFLAESRPILEGGWAQLKVGTMVGGLASRMVLGPSRRAPAPRESPEAALERYAESLVASLQPPPRRAAGEADAFLSPWPGMPASLATLKDLSSDQLLAKEGRLGFVLLRLVKSNAGFAGASEATDELRRLIAMVAARHPSASIGLTGLPIMEDDEMRASQQSMLWASGVSMAAVILVIVAGFGGVRHALMANGVLVIGMGWAFAWATATVGHLNILSVTFTVTMIGVGIDYGTYYVGRYLEARRRGLGCEEALLETSGSVGPGILTGDPFVDAANGNFQLNNTAGAGAACRAAGFPGTVPGLSAVGYADIGVYQHQDPAGGGGLARIIGG